ncbi:carboxypeptidase C (cathepsin A) [Bradyrhizobium sp. USDA 4461]
MKVGEYSQQDAAGPASLVRKSEVRPLDNFDAPCAPVEEHGSVTSHTIRARGRALAYKATAGTLTIRDGDGKPHASFFYVGYTLDDPKGGPNHRPVTFLYNGGPSVPSIGLHLGSFGPMRLSITSPDGKGAASFLLGPNEETLLDRTDLVFIDAIGTGYSRALGKTDPKAFWGVDQDADAFARAISRYIVLNSRTNSPKFLFGISYGATRSAVVAYNLRQRDINLNGVVLLSSWLNTSASEPGFDLSYAHYLPSYAAAAWFHDKVPNKPPDQAAFLDEVRAWAGGPYAAALFKGDGVGQPEFDQIAEQMSAYIGISVDYIKKAKLRVKREPFRRELLRDRGRTIGFYDSRCLGQEEDAAGQAISYDPSTAALSGAFFGLAEDYIIGKLKYATDLEYRLDTKIGTAWDFRHTIINDDYHGFMTAGGRKANVAPVYRDLAQTMRENPRMKVLSLNGWYDLCTPFLATEYDLNHMLLDPTIKANLSVLYYRWGHSMLWADPDALKQMRADLGHFYEVAAPQ